MPKKLRKRRAKSTSTYRTIKSAEEKVAGQVAAPTLTVSRPVTASKAISEPDRYRYVLSDLKRTAITAAIVLVVLVVLYFALT